MIILKRLKETTLSVMFVRLLQRSLRCLVFWLHFPRPSCWLSGIDIKPSQNADKMLLIWFFYRNAQKRNCM